MRPATVSLYRFFESGTGAIPGTVTTADGVVEAGCAAAQNVAAAAAMTTGAVMARRRKRIQSSSEVLVKSGELSGEVSGEAKAKFHAEFSLSEPELSRQSGAAKTPICGGLDGLTRRLARSANGINA